MLSRRRQSKNFSQSGSQESHVSSDLQISPSTSFDDISDVSESGSDVSTESNPSRPGRSSRRLMRVLSFSKRHQAIEPSTPDVSTLPNTPQAVIEGDSYPSMPSYSLTLPTKPSAQLSADVEKFVTAFNQNNVNQVMLFKKFTDYLTTIPEHQMQRRSNVLEAFMETGPSNHFLAMYYSSTSDSVGSRKLALKHFSDAFKQGHTLVLGDYLAYLINHVEDRVERNSLLIAVFEHASTHVKKGDGAASSLEIKVLFSTAQYLSGKLINANDKLKTEPMSRSLLKSLRVILDSLSESQRETNRALIERLNQNIGTLEAHLGRPLTPRTPRP